MEDFWDKSAPNVVIAAYTIGLLGGLAVFGWQVFYWLRNGIWMQIPFYDAFAALGINFNNAYISNDWKGLSKILQWAMDLPLSIMIPVAFASFAIFWRALVSAANKEI